MTADGDPSIQGAPSHPRANPLRALDEAVFDLVRPSRGRPVLDRAMYTLSQAGNHSAIWHGINLLEALTGGRAGRRAALRRSVIQVVEQVLVNGPIKLVFRRTRPTPLAEHPHELRKPVTSSFPSGHASAGFCAATLLSADLEHPLLWYGLATAVSWSRVHVGVHYPSDVVGGAVIGTVLARAGLRVWPAGDR